jgi:hypothetical protein
MIDKIYEHLKTRKKYNTLELKYDVKCEELERKVLELNTEKRVRIKQQDIFNERLQELLELNLKLKEENTKLKKEIKKNGTKSA